MQQPALFDDVYDMDISDYEEKVATQIIKKRPPRSRQQQVTIRRKVEDVLEKKQAKIQEADPWDLD